MKIARTFIVGVVLLALMSAGVYLGYQQIQGDGDTETVSGVPESNETARTENVITAESRIVPIQEAKLALTTSGVVTDVPVYEGMIVNKGDSLLQLDIAEQELAVTQAETAVSIALINLNIAQADHGLIQIELDMTNLSVSEAVADLALLQATPQDAQVSLAEQELALAEAGIDVAASKRALVLEGAPDPEIAAANAELVAAQTAYDNALKTYQPILQDEHSEEDEKVAAQLYLNAAQASVTAAQKKLDLLLAGATPGERLTAQLEVDMAVSERDLTEAQNVLQLAGTREEQIAIAQIIIEQRQTAVQEVENRLAGAEIAVAQAETAVEEAKIGLETAKAALQARTLFAPFAGTVVTIDVKPGEMVQAHTPVMVLADLSQWQVETTDLTELDVVAVDQGFPVVVQVDAFPDQILHGDVVHISEVGTEVLGDIIYEATIQLQNPDNLPLRWGMTAFVNVMDNETDDLPPVPSRISSATSLKSEGQLVPGFYANVAFQTTGYVHTIFVNEGDVIHASDPLVALQTDDLVLSVNQAETQVKAAETRVTAMQNQLALAETAVIKANDGVKIAQANLDLVKAGPTAAEIAAAEAALSVSELAVALAQAETNVALNTVSEADLDAAEANLAAINANIHAQEVAYQDILDSCFDTPDGQTICPLYGPVEEQARAGLEVAYAQQAAAQAAVDMLKAGPSLAQRSVANNSQTLALANRDIAQAHLDLLLADISPERIKKAEIGVTQAELGVALAQAQVAKTEALLDQAKANLQQSEIQLQLRQTTLERMTLVSMTDGQVVRIQTNEGETVLPGSPIITLADNTTWLVETTDVSELDVASIEIGDVVHVHFDAIPDRTLSGIVKAISQIGNIVQGDVMYTVTIELPDDANALPLRWGMTSVIEFDN